MSTGPADREALARVFKSYHERHTVCREPGCEWGYVVLDVAVIDPFTLEPEKSVCPTCKGAMFVPRQMELPLASPEPTN